MTEIYFVRFGVILHILYATCSDDQPNLCPEATGCRCIQTWTRTGRRILGNKMVAHCGHTTDPRLEFLPAENLTKVLLSHNTFTNISLLSALRNTTATRFTLTQNRFQDEERPMFNWDWLPSTASNLSLARNGFYGFQTGQQTNNCNVSRFRDRFGLVATGEKFNGIPSCLPDTVRQISLLDLVGNQIETGNEWPSHLSVLRVSGGDFGKFSSKLFLNSPSSLTTLWITQQKLKNSSWLTGLPTDSMKRLLITHSELHELPKVTLERLGKANTLEQLSLSFNNLTDVPKNLPGSLKSLLLDHNNIRHVTAEHWSTLKNLVSLSLRKNGLLSVPLEMPVSLTRIYLNDNEIFGSHPDAFRHLKHLKTLDLSYNKLTTLPEGIQPSLVHYRIHGNQISLVNSPDEYDFCAKCTYVTLYGNPWHCNLEMLKMLNWFIVHNVEVQDEGYEKSEKGLLAYCNPVGFKGTDSSWLPTALEYMDYFRQPPNDNCIYEIETLKCTDADLVELPDRIPPGLIYISIRDNSQLTSVPDYKFYNQTVLRELKLDNNSLSHIPVGLPPSLIFLSLDDNNLGSWTDEDLLAFKNLTLLRYLHLNNNNIRDLYSWQFEGLQHLKWIGLAGNPLHCDCSLQSFSYYFARLAPVMSYMVAGHYPTCKTPPDREHIDIRRLEGYYSYGINCIPTKCGYDFSTTNKSSGILNCSKDFQTDETRTYLYTFVPGEEIHIPTSTFWIEIDLSGLELQSSQINYKNLSRVEIVDLSSSLHTWQGMNLRMMVKVKL